MSCVLEIFQVDAFTSQPFGGNPAGVVLAAEGLSDDEMQKVAGEMKCAETAFVTPATRPDRDLQLRWFTPSGKEVRFCGHATVATVHVLVETGRWSRDRVVFDTLGGALPVAVSRTREGNVIWLEPALPTCAPYSEPLGSVLEALGMASTGLASWARPSLTPERDLLLPAIGLDVLRSVSPDMPRLARLGTDGGIRGFCLTARETVDQGSLTHSRFFAPHYGIPEDPVTGSVHAALGVWLWQAGLLSVDGDVASFQAEQGDLLGRAGRLKVELRVASSRPASVRVGGQAVTVLSGSIRVA